MGSQTLHPFPSSGSYWQIFLPFSCRTEATAFLLAATQRPCPSIYFPCMGSSTASSQRISLLFPHQEHFPLPSKSLLQSGRITEMISQHVLLETTWALGAEGSMKGQLIGAIFEFCLTHRCLYFPKLSCSLPSPAFQRKSL